MSAPWEDFGGGAVVETPPWEDFGAVDSIKGNRQDGLESLEGFDPTIYQRLSMALPSVFGPVNQPQTGAVRGLLPVLEQLLYGQTNPEASKGAGLLTASPALLMPEPTTQVQGFAHALAEQVNPSNAGIVKGLGALRGLNTVGANVVKSIAGSEFATQGAGMVGDALGKLSVPLDVNALPEEVAARGRDKFNALMGTLMAVGTPAGVAAEGASLGKVPVTGQKPQFEPSREFDLREQIAANELKPQLLTPELAEKQLKQAEVTRRLDQAANAELGEVPLPPAESLSAQLGRQRTAQAQLNDMLRAENEALVRGQEVSTPDKKLLFDTPIIGQKVQGQSIIQPMPPRPNQPTGIAAVPGTPGAVPGREAVGGKVSFAGEEPLPTGLQRQSPLTQPVLDEMTARMAQEQQAQQPANLADLLSLKETLTKQQIVPTKKATPVKSAYEAAQQWAQDTLKRRGGLQSFDPELLAAIAVRGSELVARGVREHGPWVAQMTKEFGEGFKDVAGDVWMKVGEQNAKEVQGTEGQVVSGQQTRGVPLEGVVGPSSGTALPKDVDQQLFKVKPDVTQEGLDTAPEVGSMHGAQIVGVKPVRNTLTEKLESLKFKTDQDMLFSLPDPKAIAGVSKAVWNTGIDLAIQAVKAGIEVARVIDDTIKYWKKNAHAQFDEASARIRLEQVLTPKAKKVEPEAPKPMTLETAPKEVAKEVEVRLANEENIWQRFVKKNFEVRTPPRVFQAEKPAPQITLDVFAQAIKDAKPAREATDILQQQARKKVEVRLKKALASAIGPGAIAEVRKAFSGFQGRVDLEPFATKMSAGELNLLFNHLLTHKEFGGYAHRIGDHYDALYKLVFDGTLPQPHHIETFERVFGPKVAEALVKKGRNSTGFWHTVAEVSGLSKSLKTSFDLSAPLRQGLVISLAHPIDAAHAFKAQIKAFGNREYANALDASWRVGEAAEIRNEAGLSLPRQEGYTITRAMEQREENYPSHAMQKLLDVTGKNKGASAALALPKLIAHGLAGSERAFVTYLNWMRVTEFDAVSADLASKIKNKEELAEARHQLALIINASTGRGNVTGSELVNALLFSQKYATSRVELPYRLIKGAVQHRKDAVGKESARQLVGTVGAWLGLYALVQAGNELWKWKMRFNIETPTSTDYLKIRLPNGTTVDFSGGESTYARFVATAMTGHTTDPRTRRQKTAWDAAVLGSFVEGKLSPMAGTGWAALHGKSQSGRKLSVGSVLTDLTVPISAENLWEAIDEHGVAGVPLMIPDVFGAGVQTPFKPTRK